VRTTFPGAFARTLTVASASALALAACASAPGAAGPSPESPAASPAPPPSASPAGFTAPVDNCGFHLAVDSAPERIVTIKSTSTELVLALGLGEKLVGTAFPDGDLPDHLTLPNPPPPVLSEKAPGSEAVLAVEPDFIFAGWESNLTAENAGERADLAELGIATYVAPPACQEAPYQPAPLTFEHIFAYITEAGALLGAPEAAADLVAAQRAELAAITPAAGSPTAVWYSSGSDIPFVGGGIGAPQLLMETAGLRNINADLPETWASVAWEAIAAEDPDLIVLVDSAWNSVDHKIQVLESNPVTAAMTAVREGSYLVVDFPASEAGVRSVAAAASLAEQAAGW